jgi:hypothetical protein
MAGPVHVVLIHIVLSELTRAVETIVANGATVVHRLRVLVQLGLGAEIRLMGATFAKVVGVGVGDVLLLSGPGTEESLASRTIHVRVLTLSMLLERSQLFKVPVAMPTIAHLRTVPSEV